MTLQQEMMQPLAFALAAKMDAEIQSAIDEAMGKHVTMAEIASMAANNRLHRRRLLGQNFDTFILDGRPILEMYDPEFHSSGSLQGSLKVGWTQNYRKLSTGSGRTSDR